MERILSLSLFICLLAFFQSATAQYCTDDKRFSEAEYFTLAQLDSSMNVSYATAPDEQGNPEVLAMDIYYPAFAEDTMSKRPFIMLIHGGGYVSGDRSQLRFNCLEFAKRGFVAATLTHRFGQRNTLSTLYRAQQDGDAGMRYIATWADSFRIDTAWLFMGGVSSGSNITLDMVYTQEEDWQAIDSTLITNFGGLNTTGNDLTTAFKIRGLFNNWGSALLTGFDSMETVPLISFHGEQDPIINIDIDSMIFRGGSRALHNALTMTGQCSDLTVDLQGRHGVYTTRDGGIFRIGRTSCFFKSLFCANCNSVYATEVIPPACAAGTTTSIQESLDQLRVYPNPFSDRITAEGLNGTEAFTLLSPLGAVLYQGADIAQYSTTNLSSGIYYLRIQSDRRARTLKLLKQN